MGFLHVAQLGDGTMDALESGLQQQAQGPGAAAFLDGLAPGFHPGDLPLQADLFLFEPLAGALLEGEGFGELLGAGLLGLEVVEELLPLLLERGQGAGDPIAAGGVLLELLLEFAQALLLLTQALDELLLLGLERGELGLEVLALAAALLLLFEPAAAAASHFPEAPAGEFDGGFGAAAVGFGLLEAGLVVGAVQLALLLLEVGLLAAQLHPLALQLFGALLVLLGLAAELPGAGLQTRQLRLHRQQLVFPEGLDLGLQRLEGLG